MDIKHRNKGIRDEIKMRIISLNINDFGGTQEHLACYKNSRNHTNWNAWRNVPKTHVIDKLKYLVLHKDPTVFILQEFELNNSNEPMEFIKWMDENGYVVKGAMPKYKVSTTIFFIKKEPISEVDITHGDTELDARDFAIKIRDYIIYGTHVPLNSAMRPTVRENYWDEIIAFYNKHKEDNLVLLGDFNTFDESTEAYGKYQHLLKCGAYDLWLRRGNPKDTPTELKFRKRLDYVFISPRVEKNVVSMDIDLDTMDKEKITDHAALILELK